MAKRRKTGGRRAGSRNKITTEVRTAVLKAFEDGLEALVRRRRAKRDEDRIEVLRSGHSERRVRSARSIIEQPRSVA